MSQKFSDVKKKVVKIKWLGLDKFSLKLSVAKYRPLKIVKLSCRKNVQQGSLLTMQPQWPVILESIQKYAHVNYFAYSIKKIVK